MIKPGDKILIAGDSWAHGEWEHDAPNYIMKLNDTYGVTHNGLGQYFSDYGCEVINVSYGGLSNNDSFLKISETTNKTKFDYIFWFQTDPIRDMRPYSNTTFPKSKFELLNMQTKLLTKTYENLNSLGVIIHCIGGITKLHSSMNTFGNLIPVIDSVIEFFGSNANDIWISDWIRTDHLQFSHEFINELYMLPPPALAPEWFSPDGVHPNRHAHKKIFEYILTC
jgi:hypothetical protein